MVHGGDWNSQPDNCLWRKKGNSIQFNTSTVMYVVQWRVPSVGIVAVVVLVRPSLWKAQRIYATPARNSGNRIMHE
jgi:hypothetical protein